MKPLRQPYPLINTKKKFILFTNAKCGGTTLKRWFVDSLNLEDTFSNTSVAIKNYGLPFVLKWYSYKLFNHNIERIKTSNASLRKFIKLYRLSTKTHIEKHLKDSAYCKFAVIRNPYERLVSGFVDKFCGNDLNKFWVQDVLKEVDSKDSNGSLVVTFSQFVDYLYNSNLLTVNSHWRHQSYILESVDLDFTIDLKDMSKKLPELSNQFNFKTTLNFDKKRQSNIYREADYSLLKVYDMTNQELIKFKNDNGFFPQKHTFYNDELKQKVRHIYKADFQRFKY